jgi:hypothetical protein
MYYITSANKNMIKGDISEEKTTNGNSNSVTFVTVGVRG